MNELIKRIEDVIRENTIYDSKTKINLEDEFVGDLGFDSIKFMGLFYSLEEEFNIPIISSNENYIFFSVVTVKDLVDILKKVIYKE
ncbi:hypothetical protein KQI30_13785 [Clostridium bornimense]|uniref:acyl carrier protein n=1 Tax=Clostridium bornimense TaxID=1216932 RepID=UPI001C119BF2|nr:phosphopantetheine-binding protein [Clostridium bornimense]MBU5317322.1 hypothetical protein [Clostridium bornimense]